jgi:WD40 repeat protein
VKWSDCARYYALSYRATIDLYSVQSGDIVSTISVGHSVTSFVFIPNEMIAVSSDQPSIQLFSNASGECVAELKGHSQRVKTLAVLPEKNCLFSASSDGSVRAWKLAQPLGDSVCMSVCETGSRFNCIALTSHSSEKQATTEDKGQSFVSSHVSKERREVKQAPSCPSTEDCNKPDSNTKSDCLSTEGGKGSEEDETNSVPPTSRTFRRHRPRRRGYAGRFSQTLPFLHKRPISIRRYKQYKHLARYKK